MDENSTQQPADAPQPTPQPAPAQTPQPQPSPASAPQPAPAPQPQPSIIESASATTSSDNHAGAAPYVIVAATLAVLVALSLALANLVSAVGEGIGDAYDEDYYDSFDYDGLLDDLDDLDPQGSTGHDLTADNVFDVELTCTDYTVDDYVFASDYSGSQQAVSAYVKALAKTDADAAGQLAGHLRAAAAATDDASRADEICQDASAAIDGLALPGAADITGGSADDILEHLTEGRDATRRRWDKLAQLVAVLASPDGHTSSELSDLDNDAGDVTDPAIDLTRALATSASDK
ncbi:hypothetical protein [Parolsenella catena]|uniref:hypothetical protein n=1 Tax=Parolsenella catena TaxID=2003188 RepID=UPI003077764F